MTSKSNRFISRRRTPWDLLPVRTQSEDFIRNDVVSHYNERHPDLYGKEELELINSYVPASCRFCGSAHFKKNGFYPYGVRQYKCCDCNKKFSVITGTIFDSHKISITEWIEYWRNLLQYLSLSADSWNNKNAFTTAKYWFAKTCLLLDEIQDSILLEGDVYCDETFIPVRSEDIIRKENYQKLRGHSINQMCIATITDGKTVFVKYIGLGEPAGRKVYEALKDHIKQGSRLITDEDPCHNMLVRKLELKNIQYDSKKMKGLPDNKNPMNPINQVHNRLQKFLRAHSGFRRDELPGYLNLFAFSFNAPHDLYEKLDRLLNLSFENPKTLRCREQYRKSKPDL